MSAYPASPEPINWEYYKAKISKPGFVDSFKKQVSFIFYVIKWSSIPVTFVGICNDTYSLHLCASVNLIVCCCGIAVVVLIFAVLLDC